MLNRHRIENIVFIYHHPKENKQVNYFIKNVKTKVTVKLFH